VKNCSKLKRSAWDRKRWIPSIYIVYIRRHEEEEEEEEEQEEEEEKEEFCSRYYP